MNLDDASYYNGAGGVGYYGLLGDFYQYVTETVRASRPTAKFIANPVWTDISGARWTDARWANVMSRFDWICIEHGAGDTGLTNGATSTSGFALRSQNTYIDQLHALGVGVMIYADSTSADVRRYEMARYLDKRDPALKDMIGIWEEASRWPTYDQVFNADLGARLSRTDTNVAGSEITATFASGSAAYTPVTFSSAAITVGPEGLSIYWGARIDSETYGSGIDAPWDANTWNTFESHAGKTVSILHFGQPMPWDQAFAASPFDLTVARGAIPMVSYQHNDLAGIAAGNYDAAITTWANAVAAWAKPFFLRFDWEMNGTWYDYGDTAAANPQAYIDAWRHFKNVVDAAGATNATWTFCPNVKFTGSTSITALYPGASYVDWMAMDGYNWGTNPLKPAGWTSFYNVFKATYDELQTLAPTKPIVICEWACSEYGGNKASWITDALGTQLPQNFPNIKGVVWFNWPIVENGGPMDWPIESSAGAQSAFAAGIGSSYYKAAGTVPAGGKVPVP
jgi:hypothetical protein